MLFINHKADKIIGLRIILLFMALVLMVPASAGCETDTGEETRPADYGSYGSAQAREIASRFPYRSPGSDQEYETGEYLIEILQEMGYEPDVKSFSFQDSSGELLISRNISITIPGNGFRYVEEDPETGDIVETGENFHRQVIIGAHYDTKISAEQARPEETQTTGSTEETDAAAETSETEQILDWTDYTGIHDNASGIAVILALAREMAGSNFGYDVTLVLFGAGEADQAGSSFFAGSMTSDQIADTDAMYCIDGIYAGDKVYAHSGWNTLRTDTLKNYEKRRKLYEATDVFYEYELYTNNGYMLYTNQSSIDVHLPAAEEPAEPDTDGEDGTGEEVESPEANAGPLYQYREWSLLVSDYRPFDEANIPIIFFDSGDYDIDNIDEMKESNNPAFGLSNGQIRHTQFDSTAFLAEILSQSRAGQADTEEDKKLLDQLSRRINNTAFIILEAVRKGIHNATAVE